jgi:pilus assembly protein CpaD
MSLNRERLFMRSSAVLAILAALALSACATTDGPSDTALAPPVTPTERFPIEVKSQPEELRLAPHSAGLSRNQEAALADFAAHWVNTNGGDVSLRTPHGGDPAAAYRTSTDARDLLVAHGVDPASIRMEGYEAESDHAAPVILAFTRYVAKGPECGRSWDNLTSTGENREYDNFGCAVTANMAAQIANPGDLVTPQAMQPADATRRQAVLDHYRKGEVTSSAADAQANGAVSRAVP